jgi:hypothetical protein
LRGFYSDDRLKKLVMDKTTPRNRNEQEIAGYRDVLNTIHENFDYIDVKPGNIQQLHRDLYKFQGPDAGGKYKAGDNVIAEVDRDGKRECDSIRFLRGRLLKQSKTFAKPMMTHCRIFTQIRFWLCLMFILDFLCIHPFNDGNGRMSRLLTLLLLYKNSYIVGKYISIEKMIETTKETYYEALQASSAGWHEEKMIMAICQLYAWYCSCSI